MSFVMCLDFGAKNTNFTGIAHCRRFILSIPFILYTFLYTFYPFYTLYFLIYFLYFLSLLYFILSYILFILYILYTFFLISNAFFSGVLLARFARERSERKQYFQRVAKLVCKLFHRCLLFGRFRVLGGCDHVTCDHLF